jgi:hypothetical protein
VTAGDGLSPALQRLIKLVAKAAMRKKLREAVALHEKASAAAILERFARP